MIVEEQHTAFVTRIRAERAERGEGPFIENPAVYLLLATVLDVQPTEQTTTAKS